MSRNRPNSRARRRKRKQLDELRKLEARTDGVYAKTFAEADGATSAQNSTAGATNNTEASKVEDPSIQEPKPKCKHHHLPNRLFFERGTKFERQDLAIERNATKRIDDKIIEMTTVLDAQYRRIMRAVKLHATQLRSENRDLAKRLKRVEKQNHKLENRVDDLEDDILRNRSEMSRERLERIRAAHA
ncbi:uncharacterized protein FTOL_10993 [Fusarium torulosum]|uniref:Uncharacterized protein n=1 Tax=Fusarium torulosum TaxID=33205 RepID=A0AAE8SMJ5_9HYPO|nr:uncharacterized protein FTOL_10993 [Fusarium torulosum]